MALSKEEYLGLYTKGNIQKRAKDVKKKRDARLSALKSERSNVQEDLNSLEESQRQISSFVKSRGGSLDGRFSALRRNKLNDKKKSLTGKINNFGGLGAFAGFVGATSSGLLDTTTQFDEDIALGKQLSSEAVLAEQERLKKLKRGVNSTVLSR